MKVIFTKLNDPDAWPEELPMLGGFWAPINAIREDCTGVYIETADGPYAFRPCDFLADGRLRRLVRARVWLIGFARFWRREWEEFKEPWR